MYDCLKFFSLFTGKAGKQLLKEDSNKNEDCDDSTVIKSHAEEEQERGEEEEEKDRREEEQEEKEKRPQEHRVNGGETLVSIAAMYDVTPSQLAQHNKLGRTSFHPSWPSITKLGRTSLHPSWLSITN